MSKTFSSSGETKEQRVLGVFEAIAQDYDFMNSVMSLGRHKAWRRFALNKLGVTPGATAIDVCCGTCDLTIGLAEQVGVLGKVVGLDFSAQMLQVGESKLRQRRANNVLLVEGSALALPFPDNSFDYATMAFALRNVNDITRAMCEMGRVVKPGGRVMSLDISHPKNPLVRQLYYSHLNYVLPRAAGWLVKRHREYAWLPESLQGFPDSDALSRLFSACGLVKLEHHLIWGGIAALHIGSKPD